MRNYKVLIIGSIGLIILVVIVVIGVELFKNPGRKAKMSPNKSIVNHTIRPRNKPVDVENPKSEMNNLKENNTSIDEGVQKIDSNINDTDMWPLNHGIQISPEDTVHYDSEIDIPAFKRTQ